jgi:hypothetical protein
MLLGADALTPVIIDGAWGQDDDDVVCRNLGGPWGDLDIVCRRLTLMTCVVVWLWGCVAVGLCGSEAVWLCGCVANNTFHLQLTTYFKGMNIITMEALLK